MEGIFRCPVNEKESPSDVEKTSDGDIFSLTKNDKYIILILCNKAGHCYNFYTAYVVWHSFLIEEGTVWFLVLWEIT